MSERTEHAVTLILRAATRGDRAAAAELLPLVYEELRRLARSRMAKLAPGQTLQPTALVHEAYLRVVRTEDPGWESRGHFFGAAAEAMRQIIVEQARRKASLKRGGDRKRMDADNLVMPFQTPCEDILALDESLRRLEKEDARKHQVVLLRFFAGLTAEETAGALNVTTRTVERDWRFARAWLHQQLAETDGEDEGERGNE